LINQKKSFELIIGSGVAHSIEEWVSYCFKKYGLEWSQHIKKRSDFKSEYQTLVSDNTLLKSMGWSSSISFENLADTMINESDISDCMYS
jgi:GDPmannose 4,6-dehydratase